MSSNSPTPAKPPPGGLRVYDFRKPARLSKERKRSLEAIYGLLAKALEGWLRGRVRDPISLELRNVEEITYGEFLTALPTPCSSFIVDDVKASGQQGIIDFGKDLAFFLVDRLLGGTGQPAIFDRSLTPTERLLVRIAAERVTVQLKDVWKDYVDMDLTISGFESIPEMLLIANREDPVLVSTLEVSTGNMRSPITLCLPISSLERFFISTAARKTPPAQGTPDQRLEERKHMEGTLRTARVPVQARFREINVRLGDLASLKEGSVLNTGLSPNAGLFILVSGQRRFLGTPGKLGGKLAALIEAPVNPEPEEINQAGRERS